MPGAAHQRQAELGEFLARLKARGCSAHTIRGYTRDLAKLEAFVQTKNISQWADLSDTQAKLFLAEHHKRGLAPRSLQRLAAAARALYRHLQEEGLAPHNPFAGLRTPRPGKRLPGALPVDTLHGLLDTDPDAPLDRRDQAMLELLYSSGLRLSELTALDCGDLDWSQRLVRVMGKGGKPRLVPFGSKAARALKKWQVVRDDWSTAGSALFISRQGRRLSPRSVQYRLAARGRTGQLSQRLHPHMLRHSCASHVLQSSGDLRAVQELLGHADIGTTQIYSHLDYQHLAKAYDQAHPRARRRRRGDNGFDKVTK